MRMLALWNDDFEPVKATAVYRNVGTILAIFYGVCLASAALGGWGYSLSMNSSLRARADGAFAAVSRIGQSPAPAAMVSKPAVHVSRSAEKHRVAIPVASNRLAKPQAAVYRQASVVTPAVQPSYRPAVNKRSGTISAPASAPTIAKATVPVRKIRIASAAAKPHTIASASKQARYMVQVASVRNMRNAQVLTAQLRKMGFDAKIHPGKHDPYLHVQIGPFTDIAQAKAMRRRVTARGYTASLK